MSPAEFVWGVHVRPHVDAQTSIPMAESGGVLNAGSGISTSPFGFSPIVIDGSDPIGESGAMGTILGGTSVGGRLAFEGWVEGDGRQPAWVVAGSAAVDRVGSSVGSADLGAAALLFSP